MPAKPNTYESKSFSGVREIVSLKIEAVSQDLKAFKELWVERDRLYTERFSAIEKANEVALIGMKDSMAATLSFTKEAVGKAAEESIRRFDSIDKKIEEILEQQMLSRGRSQGANWLWTVLAAASGLLIGVLGMVIHAK